MNISNIPTKQRGFNFNPGPAVLPEEVLRKAQDDIWSYRDSGMGVAELSHRGPHFEEIIYGAEALVRELLNLNDDYAVLFVTGGATQQFSMIPMNLLVPGTIGNYMLSDVWGEYALDEARKFGEVFVAGSTKEAKYRSIPALGPLSANAAYLHFTSNNTIAGTQFREEPDCPAEVPLLCDASSDILSKPIATSRYSLIYAGAQKNIGPAGVTLVVLKKSLLKRCPEKLPTMLDYRTYEKSRSLHNTPPTLSIYLLREVLNWIKDCGGVTAIQKRNEEKAAILYERLDESGFYQGIVEKNSRSMMNVTFRLRNSELEKDFLEGAAEHQLFGLKGHRVLGGFRASLYNALPLQAVEALVSFMNAFENAHG